MSTVPASSSELPVVHPELEGFWSNRIQELTEGLPEIPAQSSTGRPNSESTKTATVMAELPHVSPSSIPTSQASSSKRTAVCPMPTLSRSTYLPKPVKILLETRAAEAVIDGINSKTRKNVPTGIVPTVAGPPHDDSLSIEVHTARWFPPGPASDWDKNQLEAAARQKYDNCEGCMFHVRDWLENTYPDFKYINDKKKENALQRRQDEEEAAKEVATRPEKAAAFAQQMAVLAAPYLRQMAIKRMRKAFSENLPEWEDYLKTCKPEERRWLGSVLPMGPYAWDDTATAEKRSVPFSRDDNDIQALLHSFDPWGTLVWTKEGLRVDPAGRQIIVRSKSIAIMEGYTYDGLVDEVAGDMEDSSLSQHTASVLDEDCQASMESSVRASTETTRESLPDSNTSIEECDDETERADSDAQTVCLRLNTST